MALLFVDGFDHYASADQTKKWNSVGAFVTIASSSGRRSGGALSIPSSNRSCSKVLPSAYATLVVGFAYNPSTGNSNDIMRFQDGSTVHCGIYVTATGAISAWRNTNATVLGTSANSVVPTSGYCYIEVKATINDSSGAIQVKVNGVSVLNLTSQDTRNGGNSTADTVTVCGNSVDPCLFDDLYICDTSGSTNNDFLGDCRVDTLYPNGDGNYSQFTCSTGTTHYTLVDETTPNTSDYNDGSGVGDRDSYTMGNLSSLTSQTVYGVQVNAAINKDDAGSKSATTFVRSSSTDGDGASAALGTSQTYLSQVFETDPNGSVAWTQTTVNAIEAGVKVTA